MDLATNFSVFYVKVFAGGTGVYEGVGVKALRVDSENRGP